MDDILIHSCDQSEHDHRLRAVLQRLKDTGLMLNDNCEFSKERIRFLGHFVSSEGIQADPAKTKAIRTLPPPTNVTELQRFLGMVNQLAEFIPDLACTTEPLQQLLKKYQVWVSDSPQYEPFERIKEKLSSADTLMHYGPHRPTIVAADASKNGLGAVLLQVGGRNNRRPGACFNKHDGLSDRATDHPPKLFVHCRMVRRPVGRPSCLLKHPAVLCYASRSLTDAETRYPVIELEALAAAWACEKFSEYLLGLYFRLETSQPLVPLLSTTDLSRMPPRILRF